MPELPEVETMRRGILPAVGGRIILVETCRCRRRPITIAPSLTVVRRRLVGRTIDDVRRLGKRVVLCVGEDRLIIEPRMTGLLVTENPPSQEHLRLRIGLEGVRLEEILFWDRRGLGVVRLLTRQECERLASSRLGPDALEIDTDTLRDVFARSRRPIKVALLDQSRLAGVGNLYASEILHLARIHPATRCDKLTRDHWLRIHQAMRQVLLTAIRYEGSTLSDGTYRNAQSNPGGYQNHHRVYDRADELCSSCRNATIQRVVQAQQSTFFCPHCQPRSSRTLPARSKAESV